MSAKKFVFRVARPIQKGESDLFWSARARTARQLFPSDTLVVAKEGNRIAKEGKLELRGAPHLGKRDVVEYLLKVYGIRAIKVNSLNFQGKLKRSAGRKAYKTYRTKAFKKFIVTVDKQAGMMPEMKLVEAEVIKPTEQKV